MQENDTSKVILITGGAKRIGLAITRLFHSSGWRIVCHYNTSQAEANQLADELNALNTDSAYAVQADLSDPSAYSSLIENAFNKWGRLDALINNASVFVPSVVGEVSFEHWQNILCVNVQAPFFLSQAALPYLQKTKGSVVNITDSHADGRPIKNFAVYSISKAALLMQTQALARELAPLVRVNAVAPGVSLWEDLPLSPLSLVQQEVLERTPLKRSAEAQEVASAVKYLVMEASYSTGSVVYVDGGRCVFN
jgi:pteridine reductase